MFAHCCIQSPFVLTQQDLLLLQGLHGAEGEGRDAAEPLRVCFRKGQMPGDG